MLIISQSLTQFTNIYSYINYLETECHECSSRLSDLGRERSLLRPKSRSQLCTISVIAVPAHDGGRGQRPLPPSTKVAGVATASPNESRECCDRYRAREREDHWHSRARKLGEQRWAREQGEAERKNVRPEKKISIRD